MPLIDLSAGSPDFDAVRATLDVSLGSGTLPDATIALPVYAPHAEAMVYARYPDADTRPPAENARLRTAVIYLTAALLAPFIPALIRETFPQFSYERAKVDPLALAALLEARAEEEMALVPNPVVGVIVEDMPPWFGLASGDRGSTATVPSVRLPGIWP